MIRAAAAFASALASAFMAVVMVLAMMDLVSAGMKQGSATSGTAAIAPQSAASTGATAGTPAAGATFDKRVGDLLDKHRDLDKTIAERLAAAEGRAEPGASPPAGAAVHGNDGAGKSEGFFAWVSAGTRLTASSGQWWNYLALTVCLWVLLTIVAVHLTVSLEALPVGAMGIAALCDWAINAPPILGVVGTIIAFAGFISSSGSSVISPELFGRAFFDAAATTVVGGLIYVVNLLLFTLLARELGGE